MRGQALIHVGQVWCASPINRVEAVEAILRRVGIVLGVGALWIPCSCSRHDTTILRRWLLVWVGAGRIIAGLLVNLRATEHTLLLPNCILQDCDL